MVYYGFIESLWVKEVAMSRVRLFLISLVVLSLPVLSAQAAGRQVVHPLGDKPVPPATAEARAGFPVAPASAQLINPPELRVIFQKGADHIISQQCADGGFGWPHNDCTTTYHNIIAPIMMGVLTAYPYTRDMSTFGPAKDAGAFEMGWQWPNGESRLHTFSSYYLWQLSVVTGDSQYAKHAQTAFFDELNAGTYGPTDMDTAGFIASVVAGRASMINAVPWDFHVLVRAAAALGYPGQSQDFVAAILASLDQMDSSDPNTQAMDILGVAGAVQGLAFGNTTSFPAIVAPLHGGISGISSLQGLADWLESQQNADGSWNWASTLGSPGLTDEDLQTTAYAVMALETADSLVGSDYAAAVDAGKDWLAAQQLANGGFPEWPTGPENTEVEGEVLWALGFHGATEPIPTLGGRGLTALVVLLMAAAVAVLRRRLG